MRRIAVVATVAMTVMLAAGTSTASRATATPTLLTATTLPKAFPHNTSNAVTVASGPVCPSVIPPKSLSAITFLNATTGLGVLSGCGPRLAVTRDSGKSWRVTGGKFPAPIDDFSPEAMPTMVFASARVGWVLGGGVLVATRDGGSSWTRVPLGGRVEAISRSGSSLWAFVAPCMANPRACSYRLEATTFNSRSWRKIGLLPASLGNFLPLVVTRLTPERAIVAIGQMGTLPTILTTDGGVRWFSEKVCSPPGFVAVALATTGPSDPWALCLGGASMSSSLKSLVRSTDGGKTWKLVAADRSLSGGTPLPVPAEDGDILAIPSPTRLWMMTVNSFFGSLDGGKIWFTVHDVGSDGAGTFASFSFVSGTDGWLLAPFSGLWRTTDGKSWHAISAAVPGHIEPALGLAGNGMAVRTILYSLRAASPSRTTAKPTGIVTGVVQACAGVQVPAGEIIHVKVSLYSGSKRVASETVVSGTKYRFSVSPGTYRLTGWWGSKGVTVRAGRSVTVNFWNPCI